MRLQVDDFDREVQMDIVFEEVVGSSVGFKDVYDGFIGIAPWQQYPEKKSANFMWQLKEAGLIDHQVVMINTGSADHNSVVKFGSWDTTAVKDGKLQQLKTINSTEWTLQAD